MVTVVNRCLTPPNNPSSSPNAEAKPDERKRGDENDEDEVKDSISPFTQPSFLSFAKGEVWVLGIYHGILSLALSTPPNPNIESSNPQVFEVVLKHICPNPDRLNPSLFTFSLLSSLLLVITIASALLRILAFSQLGRDFTFQLQRPTGLVTTGLYRYVRHPSYTFLVLTLIGFGALIGRPDGGLACWMTVDEGVWWVLVGLGVCGGVLGTVVRVREEERLLEREFKGKGVGWEEWVQRTGRFVPWVF